MSAQFDALLQRLRDEGRSDQADYMARNPDAYDMSADPQWTDNEQAIMDAAVDEAYRRPHG